MIEDCLVVEFAVGGDDCPLGEVTGALGTAVQCCLPLSRSDGTTLLRCTATERGDDLVAALDADERVDFLHAVDGDGGTTVRFLSGQPCVVHDLVDAGFLLESLEYRDGTGYFAGSVIGYDALQNVLRATRDAIGVDLHRVYPRDASDEDHVVKKWDLTPAQEEALRTAYEMNYLSVPREVTAEDVAGELDISKSALLERLRRGEQRVLSQMYGDAAR